MKNIIFIILFLGLMGCSGFTKVSSQSGKVILRELDNFLKTTPKVIDGNVDIAKHIRNFNFRTSNIREVLDNVRYRELYETAFDECMENMWKQELKKLIREVDQGPKQTNIYLQNKAKKIFSKELARLGPFKVEFEPIGSNIKLSFDTPCGTEEYLKNVNKDLNKSFQSIVFSTEAQKEKNYNLLIGSWYDLYEKNLKDFRIFGIGKTFYKPDFKLRSDFTIICIYMPEKMTVYTLDAKIFGTWELTDTHLMTNIIKFEVINTQDPADLLDSDDYNNIINKMKGAHIKNKLVLLTSSILIATDDQGVTSKSVKAD